MKGNSRSRADQRKIDDTCATAMATIERFRQQGNIPALMIFVSPDDGFKDAHAITPMGMDPYTVICFMKESMERKQ